MDGLIRADGKFWRSQVKCALVRRASYATHLLEQKVDIRVIQVLLGHKKLETTSLYAQVATDVLRSVISPLDKSLHTPDTE